jgi:hypothetical protein
MGIGRRLTDDKPEVVSRVICLRFNFNFISCTFPKSEATIVLVMQTGKRADI